MDNGKPPYIAVITGDIVNSKKHKGEDRKALDELLKKALDTIFNAKEDRTDIFRGDSFQIETDAVTSLRKALKLRSFLKTNDIEVRMAIGIGSIDYAAKNVKRSDGEAHQLSGDAFNELDKNEFLKVATPWKDLNNTLNSIILLLDSHFINHSKLQAEAVYYSLAKMHQLKIAKLLNISQPAINNRLRGASFNAIEKSLDFFYDQIHTYTKVEVFELNQKKSITKLIEILENIPKENINENEVNDAIKLLKKYDSVKEEGKLLNIFTSSIIKILDVVSKQLV